MNIQMKRKIAFALLMGVVTTGIISFTLLALTHRIRLAFEPALSFVPDARAPPNGC